MQCQWRWVYQIIRPRLWFFRIQCQSMSWSRLPSEPIPKSPWKRKRITLTCLHRHVQLPACPITSWETWHVFLNHALLCTITKRQIQSPGRSLRRHPRWFPVNFAFISLHDWCIGLVAFFIIFFLLDFGISILSMSFPNSAEYVDSKQSSVCTQDLHVLQCSYSLAPPLPRHRAFQPSEAPWRQPQPWQRTR